MVRKKGFQKGILHSNWKDGKIKRKGYMYVLSPKHPNRNKQGYTREHLLIAEKALGKYLPYGAVVHHINGIKDDNRPENLIICQDATYHALLHRRERALKESENANKRKCRYCKQYDFIENMKPDGHCFVHQSCKNEINRKQYRNSHF